MVKTARPRLNANELVLISYALADAAKKQRAKGAQPSPMLRKLRRKINRNIDATILKK